MKIEVGKSYVARNGEVWTDAKPTKVYRYDWELTGEDGCTYEFLDNGRFWLNGRESDHDLVSEFAEQVERSPIRTVTRREIVPGEYCAGEIEIFGDGSAVVRKWTDSSVARQAARLFNEIADVLDENEKKDAA